ncbi:hypothetical protein Pmani_015474 [Petrolisthes manimaculis]|uniref:Uncharacterized protein n=1 Tax=Petrolisthes manimaculis TaxID=1843537 RepID=A0AAE1U7N0_9EUCA|nr:hypothetical protein Pmani_015474 [Petrolisthes manimaculis]
MGRYRLCRLPAPSPTRPVDNMLEDNCGIGLRLRAAADACWYSVEEARPLVSAPGKEPRGPPNPAAAAAAAAAAA